MHSIVKILFLVVASILATSCLEDSSFDDEFLPGYEGEDSNSGTQASWSFDNASDYQCDGGSCSSGNIVISGGQASLQTVDTEHSGSDFESGSHVGTYYDSTGDAVKLRTQVTTDSTHVNTILPAKSANLVGYWRFDGDLSDSSGSGNNGTASGNAAITSDARNGTGAISLDGTGDYISAGTNNIPFGTSGRTLMAWTKYTGDGGVIIGLNSASGQKFYFQMGNVGGQWYIFTDGIDVGKNQTVTGSDIPDTDVWFHSALTLDNSDGWAYYINGRLVKSGTFGSSINTSMLTSVTIGERLDVSGYEMSGIIDEVAIYNTNLLESEILRVYNSQNASFTELSSSWTPKYSSIVGYWKMDGNWQDSSGNGNHGTANGEPIFDANSKVGSHAGSYDGSGDYVQAIGNDNTTFSAMCWIKANSAISDWKGILEYSSSTGGRFGLGLDATGKPLLTYGTSFKIATLQEIDSLNWYHLVGVVSATDQKIFINGEEVAIGAPQVPVAPTGNSILNIGDYTKNGYAFNGLLDECVVWNIDLSAQEVKEIYNRQKQKYAGHYDSPVIDIGTSVPWTNLNPITSLPFYKEIAAQSSESSSDYSSLSGDLGNGLVGYWSLNEITEGTAPGSLDFKDLSGNANHIDATGVTYAQEGVLNNAIFFDGSGDYSNVSGVTINSVQTVSFWATFSSGAWKGSQVGFGTGGSNTNDIYFWGDGSNDYFGFNTWNNDSFGISGAKSLLQDGDWHHIVAEFHDNDFASNRLWIDGAEQGLSQVFGSSNNRSLQSTFGIGHNGWHTSNQLHQGNLDEVAIWSRALTATEVQQLYRRGANRIKYQIKSCVDSSCNCKAYNTSPAGSASDCDGDGTPNATDYDDIHKADFIGPGGDGSTHYSELFNRAAGDLTFTCYANTSDSDSNVCVDDEITMDGSPKATSPSFSFSDMAASAQVSSNRYFQYRVLMEAEDNTACSGSPCLPSVSAVNFTPTGIYYGGSPTITPTSPITISGAITGFTETVSGSCTVKYQFSTDGTNYFYHDGSAWTAASSSTDSDTASEVNSNLPSFTSSGSLYFKAFLESDGTQSCELQNLSVQMSN
jgi:hypothetical protein